MRLKSYFADTVEAAMALAARELGEDALLVYSRQASPESRYLGSHEVVFAAGESFTRPEAETAKPEAARAEAAAAGAVAGLSTVSRAAPAADQLAWASSALAELRSEIGSLRQDVAAHRQRMEDFMTSSDQRAWRLLADWGAEPDLMPGVALASRLLHADMDPEHVLDVIESVRDAVRMATGGENEAATAGKWKRLLERELTTRCRVDSQLGQPGRRPAILLVGPPGAGKTTVAMQLSAHAAGRGAEPRLIAFEPARLTAAHALRSYAAVLGSPFELARRGDHLATLLAGRQPDILTIVDGPGVGPVPDDVTAQLAAFQEQSVPVEAWLVLPATLRACDLSLMINRFASYRPSRLVLTRTRESRHWGAVWSAVEWAGIPAAFLCGGPRIPEDLTPASGEWIAQQVLDGRAPSGGRPAAKPQSQWQVSDLAVAGKRG